MSTLWLAVGSPGTLGPAGSDGVSRKFTWGGSCSRGWAVPQLVPARVCLGRGRLRARPLGYGRPGKAGWFITWVVSAGQEPTRRAAPVDRIGRPWDRAEDAPELGGGVGGGPDAAPGDSAPDSPATPPPAIRTGMAATGGTVSSFSGPRDLRDVARSGCPTATRHARTRTNSPWRMCTVPGPGGASGGQAGRVGLGPRGGWRRGRP
jgi:hypothetical protein